MKKILEFLILPIIFLAFCIPSALRGEIQYVYDPDLDEYVMDVEVKVFEDFQYYIDEGQVFISSYLGNETAVTVPATIENLPVTEIGEGTFKRCTNLWAVTIPEGVVKVGEVAFQDCHHLKSVTVPASVREIGMEMFAECYFLREICVAEGNPNYKSVGGVLFTKDGKKLLSYPYDGDWCYQVPEGVTTIGESAFNGCNRLLMIIIPENVAEIEMYAFNECPELTIIGKKGSDAEQYAEVNRMKFRTIEEWEEFNKGF